MFRYAKYGFVAAVVAVIGAAVWIIFPPMLFVMSAGFASRDSNPMLKPWAATALPVIAALEAYCRKHDAYPAPNDASDIAALRSLLPATVKVTAGGQFLNFDAGLLGRPWTYYRFDADRTSYSLSLKISWDPMLIYRHDKSGSRWVFDPGDGTAEHAVRLAP